MSGGFHNPIIGGGGNLVYPQINSPNFSIAGKTGWGILKNGNAYFFNITAQGTITGSTFNGTNFIINQSGAFFYTGTPASGNLFCSIASVSGTDAFTNAYGAGFNVGSQTGPHLGIDTLGDLNIFNATDKLVAQIVAGDGSMRVYNASGSGLGNLVASISPVAGTDGPGNAYPQGLAAYVTATDMYQITMGLVNSQPGIFFTNISQTAPSISPYITGINSPLHGAATGTRLHLDSGKHASAGTNSTIELLDSGAASNTHGEIDLSAGLVSLTSLDSATTVSGGLTISSGTVTFPDSSTWTNAAIEILSAVDVDATMTFADESTWSSTAVTVKKPLLIVNEAAPIQTLADASVYSNNSGNTTSQLMYISGLTGDTNQYSTGTYRQFTTGNQAITTITDITGLTATVGIGTYRFSADILMQATGGAVVPTITISGPATSGLMLQGYFAPINTAGSTVDTFATNSGLAGFAGRSMAISSFLSFHVEGCVTFSAAGTFKFRGTASANTLNIQKNSCADLMPIG
jgi:hypothetical protein